MNPDYDSCLDEREAIVADLQAIMGERNREAKAETLAAEISRLQADRRARGGLKTSAPPGRRDRRDMRTEPFTEELPVKLDEDERNVNPDYDSCLDEQPAPAPPPPEPDPTIAPLLVRLAIVGGPDDTRAEAEILDEREAIVADLQAIMGERNREAKAETLAAEISRLQAAALTNPDVLPRLREVNAKLRKVRGFDAERPIVAPADLVLQRIGRRQVRIPTGLPSWDAALRGGFAAQNLHTVAGGPDAGKTAVVLQAALFAARAGTAVVWLGYDEAREGIENRVGQAFGLALEDLENGHEPTLRRLAEIMRSIPHLLILDGEADGLTIEDAAETLRALQRRLGAETATLVVDSAQTARCRALLGPNAPRAQVERLDAVLGSLRSVARRGPCVIATSETARGTHARKGRDQTAAIAAGKGSSSIEFWSLTLWRLSRITKGDHAGDTLLEPGKNKRGAVEWRGVAIRLERDPDRCTYTDHGSIDEDAGPQKPAPQKAPEDAVPDRLLDRVRTELKKHVRGVAGGVDGLVGLVGGKAAKTRAAIRALDTAGEIVRHKGRLFHRDQNPGAPAPTLTDEQLRALVLVFVTEEATALRVVPSAAAVVRGLRERGVNVRPDAVKDAVEVLVHGGQIERNGARLVPTAVPAAG